MSARDVLATTLAYISPGALLADVILADLTAAGYSIAPPGSRVVPEAADWQPMDTAPKDGSDILVYDRGEIVTVKWADALVRRGNDTVYGWMNYRNGTGQYRPTHWMPLPAPPAFRALAETKP